MEFYTAIRSLSRLTFVRDSSLFKKVQTSFDWNFMRVYLHALSYEVGEVARADALHHPGPMIRYGLGTNIESASDLLARKPCNSEFHYFALSCRKCFDAGSQFLEFS